MSIVELVDEFISKTWGECQPEPYRLAMIEHFGQAIKEAYWAGFRDGAPKDTTDANPP